MTLVPALFTVVVLGVGVTVASVQQPTFESTARLLVGPIAGERPTLDASGLLSTTYAELLTSSAIVDQTQDRLGLPLDPSEVAALPNQESRVIVLTVGSADERVPQAAADELAVVLAELVDQRDDPLLGSADPGLLTVLDAASAPEPSRDLTTITIVSSLLVGLVGGVFLARRIPLAWFTARLDGAFLETLGIPVLRVRPDDRMSLDPAAQWDEIAARLLDMVGDDASRSMSFVPTHRERAFVDAIVELQMARARRGHLVVLADADADQPEVSGLLGVSPGARSNEDGPDVWTIDAGGNSTRSGESGTLVLVSGDRDVAERPLTRANRLIDIVAEDGEIAFLTPPVGASRCVLPVVLLADRTVLMVREGTSSVVDVRRTIDFVTEAGGAVDVVLFVGAAAPSTGVSMRLKDLAQRE